MSILGKTIQSLKEIRVARYFRSERGFAGEFYSKLSHSLAGTDLFPNQTILESEVQKTTKKHYGLRQRPDLVIHIPVEDGNTGDVTENNFVVYAFKLRGSLDKALSDFEKIEEMFSLLNYDLGIFVNINAYPNSYLEAYAGEFKNRIHELSISLVDGEVKIKHAYFVNNELTMNNV